MSTKFTQLMDLIVNEESEKANELFHQIVVEKSREIYENLIAEEAEEEMDEAKDDEEMDESADEEMDEAKEEDDEEMDESMDLEDSYSMEADDEEDPMSGSGDATDQFGADISGDDMDGEEDPEAQEDNAIMDIKNAIQELEAAFAELEQAQGGEASHGGFGDEEDGEEDGEDEMMGSQAFEGRRMTREYVEKVGNDWDKSGSQKSQGQYVGAGSGDKESAPVEGRSPVSSGKGKPTTGATAGNIAKSAHEGGTPTGTSPAGKAGGFLSAAKDMNTGNGNVPGGKMGVKNLSKVAGGHGAEKKGSGPGPVGSGTGDKAGQTSVGQAKSPINGAPNRNA